MALGLWSLCLCLVLNSELRLLRLALKRFQQPSIVYSLLAPSAPAASSNPVTPEMVLAKRRGSESKTITHESGKGRGK